MISDRYFLGYDSGILFYTPGVQMADMLFRENLAVIFGDIEDPRVDRHKIYPLTEIFFLTLVACLCGVESWRGIEMFGNDRLEFLKRYLPYQHEIPSHQTISRTFSLINAKYFEDSFIGIMRKIFFKPKDEIVAIDGKTLRGSGDPSKQKAPIHLLNVWAVKNGLSIAQIEVDCKTNEITTVPEIIDLIDIKGATVTTDALNCQTEIATKISAAGADYVLAVKGNQKGLFEAIIDEFEENLPDENRGSFFQTVEKGHGRIDTRSYYSMDIGPWLPNSEKWTNLKSVGMALSDVYKKGADTADARFFIASFSADAPRLAEAVRGHWGIENNLHWVLDVTFAEDRSTKRRDHAPRNFALMRKFAMNLMKQDKTKGRTGPMKRVKAAINLDYLAGLLAPLG